MIDPTHLVAVQSLDFGSVYTSDGREHPLTGLSGIQQLRLLDLLSFAPDPAKQSPGTTSPLYDPANTPATVKIGQSIGQAIGSWLFGGKTDTTSLRNGAIRVVLVVLGILLITVAVFRITSNN